ncbi:MAG: hypothetical protein QGG40_04725, partial [Myxococcota bacterium]|nr:hypothetical protein [Myxococcota bacterium]
MTVTIRMGIGFLLWWSTAAVADTEGVPAPPPDTGRSEILLDALDLWSNRAVQELQIEGAESPSRATFAALENETYYAKTVFGALVTEAHRRNRPGHVEVTVGQDQLNSSRFRGEGSVDVIGRPSFIVEDAQMGLERDLWISSDRAYLNAVKQYQVKSSALSAHSGDPPPADWTDSEPVVHQDEESPFQVNADLLRSIALEVSGSMRSLELRSAEAEVRQLDGRYYLVTTEGTRLVQHEGYAVVYVWADILRDDGVRVSDHRQWVARRAEDLPPVQEMTDQALAMGRSILQRAAASTVPYYEGPVVFEDEAAAALLRYLAPTELCGTPPPPDEFRTYQELVRSGPRLGRRLLPRGWAVTDDPTDLPAGMAGG